MVSARFPKSEMIKQSGKISGNPVYPDQFGEIGTPNHVKTLREVTRH